MFKKKKKIKKKHFKIYGKQMDNLFSYTEH